MRYTAEAVTSTTQSASSSITFRENDTIEAIDIIASFLSATITEDMIALVSFSQTPPGGTPDDFNLVEMEDVILVRQLSANVARYWNGSAAISYGLPVVHNERVAFPTGIPVTLGERLYLHVFNLNGALLTDPKEASVVVHTKTQVKVVRRR